MTTKHHPPAGLGYRGTGRTTRMIRDLPSQVRVIAIHTGALRPYLQQLVAKHRPDLLPSLKIVVVSRESDLDQLRGLRFAVDHEVMSHGTEDFKYKLDWMMRDQECHA